MGFPIGIPPLLSLSLSRGFGFKAIYNVLAKPKCLNILNPARKNFFEYSAVYRIKEFSDVAFERKTRTGIVPAYFFGRVFQRHNAFMCSLADSAGKRVGDKSRLKNWIKNLENRVMQYPVANRSLVDMPYFGIVNIKRSVWQMFVGHFRKLTMEFKKIIFQIKFKLLNIYFVLFPSSKFFPCRK